MISAYEIGDYPTWGQMLDVNLLEEICVMINEAVKQGECQVTIHKHYITPATLSYILLHGYNHTDLNGGLHLISFRKKYGIFN